MTHRGFLVVTITGLWLLSSRTTMAQPPKLLPDLGAQPPSSVGQLADIPDPGSFKLEQAPPAAQNQKIANAIATHLRDSGQLRHYKIDIRFQNGIATLSGRVANEVQRQTALRLTREVAGVDAVREQLLVDTRTLVPAQGFDPLQMPEVGPIPAPMAGAEPMQLPAPTGNHGPSAGSIEEPEPIFRACEPGGTMQPPPLPPYAWPTYAPYNNYSRVAYPTLYPYEAWPFIGPFYPFPKVPLGWRKITLSWEDGHWWYARNASGHDWWRIRYW